WAGPRANRESGTAGPARSWAAALAWRATQVLLRPEGRMDACSVPGRVAEVTAAATTGSHLAMELRDPLVFYLEAWLAHPIFGPDQAVIPEMVWMSHALLMVDIVNPGNLVEITIFGQPHVQNWVERVPLSLTCWHREHRAQDSPASCCISIVRSIVRTVLLLLLKFKRSKYS
ncbi:hypothetical protein HPG69_006568, partial [Diceros bicornis minor]